MIIQRIASSLIRSSPYAMPKYFIASARSFTTNVDPKAPPNKSNDAKIPDSKESKNIKNYYVHEIQKGITPYHFSSNRGGNLPISTNFIVINSGYPQIGILAKCDGEADNGEIKGVDHNLYSGISYDKVASRGDFELKVADKIATSETHKISMEMCSVVYLWVQCCQKLFSLNLLPKMSVHLLLGGEAQESRI
jgi:hypothetical protein